MPSKKLFATLAVVTAAALAPATSSAHGYSHGCPACPHPGVSVRPEPASTAPATQIEPTKIEFPNIV